jgi:hypothetical protein
MFRRKGFVEFVFNSGFHIVRAVCHILVAALNSVRERNDRLARQNIARIDELQQKGIVIDADAVTASKLAGRVTLARKMIFST